MRCWWCEKEIEPGKEIKVKDQFGYDIPICPDEYCQSESRRYFQWESNKE